MLQNTLHVSQKSSLFPTVYWISNSWCGNFVSLVVQRWKVLVKHFRVSSSAYEKVLFTRVVGACLLFGVMFKRVWKVIRDYIGFASSSLLVFTVFVIGGCDHFGFGFLTPKRSVLFHLSVPLLSVATSTKRIIFCVNHP